MKLSSLLVIALIGVNTGFAQFNLPDFNKEQAKINKTGFLVLGSWSAANIISGLALQGNAGGQTKYFHQMNLLWGSVNLLIAGSGYLGANRKTGSLSYKQSLKQQSRVEKTFLFNAGLDLAYMTAGAWFIEKGNSNSNPARYKGYGKSILLQGGFLLLFDAVMYGTHNHHGKKLYQVLNGLQIAPNSVGFHANL